MSLKDLLGRVQRLEDIEDIKKLKAGYCAACDRGYQADEIAELFTVDGIWDGGKTFGVCRSREEIRRHFQGASKRLTIARHQVILSHGMA